MKEKGLMPDAFLQRWNQQYKWVRGRETWENICLREPKNLFWLKNESAIWWQRTKQRFPVNGCEQHSDDRRVTHIIWMEALSQLQSGKLNTLPQHDHQRLRSPNVFHLNRRKLKKKSENTWRMSQFVIFKITVVILQTNGINCNEL